MKQGPDLLDLIGPHPLLHELVYFCAEAGREFDIVTFMQTKKNAKYAAARFGSEAAIIEGLDKLTELKFLETYSTQGGTKWWRIPAPTVHGIIRALEGGCTAEEIAEAPKWIQEERDHLNKTVWY